MDLFINSLLLAELIILTALLLDELNACSTLIRVTYYVYFCLFVTNALYPKLYSSERNAFDTVYEIVTDLKPIYIRSRSYFRTNYVKKLKAVMANSSFMPPIGF